MVNKKKGVTTSKRSSRPPTSTESPSAQRQQNESEEERKKRLKGGRNMRRRERGRTKEEREKMQKYARKHLRNETQEQREKRLERGREWRRQRRKNETQEQREKRLERGREWKRQRRKNETQEMREERLKKNREYHYKWCRNLTEEKREKRRKTIRECNYKRLRNETEEMRKERLKKVQEYYRERRRNQMEEMREKRPKQRQEKAAPRRRMLHTETSTQRNGEVGKKKQSKYRKTSEKGLKGQSEPDYTPSHEGTLEHTSNADTLRQRERTSRVCKQRMLRDEEIDSSEFTSASSLLSVGHASSLKDHAPSMKDDAPSVEQGEKRSQASACRTRVYKYRRTKRKSESKSVPNRNRAPFLPSPEDHAPIPLTPKGSTLRSLSSGDQSPILFSDEHAPSFPSPEDHTPSIETLLQMLQANTQTERVSKHRKSGRERSKSKSALDYIPTSLESQFRGVNNHTPSTKTLGHKEQTSWEQMSNNSESVLDQDLVPDIGREVVATDSYLEDEHAEPQYSDTAGYTVVGGGGAWNVELSNPDYTGMALLERRSHHPDFTFSNKQAGMFAVVLGSNGAELEL